ncbi:MAG: hypothetical protein AAGA18_07540 [Verrucomicrobiota bacterium]
MMTKDKKFPVLGVAVLASSGFVFITVLTLVVIDYRNTKNPNVEDVQAETRYENIAKLQEEDAKAMEGIDEAMMKAIKILKNKDVEAVPMTAPPIPTAIKSPAFKQEGSGL